MTGRQDGHFSWTTPGGSSLAFTHQNTGPCAFCTAECHYFLPKTQVRYPMGYSAGLWCCLGCFDRHGAAIDAIVAPGEPVTLFRVIVHRASSSGGPCVACGVHTWSWAWVVAQPTVFGWLCGAPGEDDDAAMAALILLVDGPGLVDAG